MSSLGTFTVDMKNVLAEMEETGDGGDSDVDGDLAETFDETVQEARDEHMQFVEDSEAVDFFRLKCCDIICIGVKVLL